MSATLRLARRFVAAYFNVGDLVLYGKYKNKKGRILEFGHDPKGNPTLVLEPIPKGRKQNKLMGLFKIWKAPMDKQAMTLAEVRRLKDDLLTEMGLKKASADDRGDAFYEVWAERLNKEAEGLDLKDSEDRSTFRTNVLEAVKHLKADGLKDLAEKMGGPVSSSRDSLVKAIANAYIAGKRLKTAMDIRKRVVARFVKAEGIPLGKTWETGTVRIHRYRGSFRITDLTNAGKRGKKVKEMTLSLRKLNDEDPWYDNMAKILAKVDSYDEVKRLIKDVQQDYPNEINLNETELRGIDVNQGGTTKINLKTNKGVEITAEPNEFLVKSTYEFEGKGENKGKKFNQDTLYYSRKKEGAGIFYNWLKANLSEANQMDINDLRKLWDQLGVKYDYH